MKIIAFLVLVLGIGLAGGAIYVTNSYFDAYEARLAESKADRVRIIVAKVDLPSGTRLEGGKHLAFEEYPEELVPDDAFTKYEDLTSGRDGERPFVVRDIEAKLPVLKGMLSGFSENERMSYRLPEGTRAFSIPINAVSGVSGFVAPGDRVDIMLTRRRDRGLESSVIMQNVLVIAVDQATTREQLGKRVGRTATVQVTNTQAQKLSVAQSIGSLSLTLRGVASKSTQDETDTVDVDDVLGLEREPERVGTSVRVRRGANEVGDVTFE
jgi:pilus assembly protein CpaB